MTSREFYQSIVDGTITAETVEYAKGRIAKLDADNVASRSKTASKKDEEYAPLVTAFVDYLKGVDEPQMASQIAAAIGVSTSKVPYIAKRVDNVAYSEIKVKGGRKVKGYALA